MSENEKDSAEEVATAAIPEPEIDATFENPALFCNKSILTIGPLFGRLTFGEHRGPDKPVHMHTSVVMAIPDLVELRNLIDRMVKRHAEHVQEAEAEGGGDA